MTQDKREKIGIRTNCNSAKSKTCDQRAKKKLSSTLLSLLETEEELFNIQWDSVPMNVQEWLTGTFTRKKEPYRRNREETAAIRSISYAVQTSVLVERKFRTTTSSVGIAYPADVVETFKEVDKWDFNAFTLNEASEGHGLTFIMCELFSKYDLLSHFKIPVTCLIAFAKALEVGYNKYQNPYHNSIHAIDVTQTVHSIMLHTGILHSLTDLEILAVFFSSSIHDYEHTGTTNHFHVETRSETALLYNDNSVLENHHVSAAYHLMESAEMNILANLNKEEWRELRCLVIQMVLSTDMSHHFQQMNTLKDCLQHRWQMEREHKSKIMSIMVHAADISHPAKPWELHQKWAKALMEEFFKQGDKEAVLGLPISPLCDRQTTNIAESQIGFIDVIVTPIFALLLKALHKVVAPLIQEAAKSPCADFAGESRRKTSTGARKVEKKENPSGHENSDETSCSTRQLLAALNVLSFRDELILNIQTNRNKWKESLVTTTKESPGTKSNKAKVQVSKGKAEEEKPQKVLKRKKGPPKFRSYCVSQQNPAACDCQLCGSSSFEPMDVSFIVYNASASETSQSQLDAEVMDVTESYEELVDNQSSWKKAAGQTLNANIQEMRSMVPKTKPLGPNESDDIIIEEFIPDDDPQPTLASEAPAVAGQGGVEKPPNASFITTDLTQSDMEIFSLWNEEVTRRAAEQQKQDQSRMNADVDCQGNDGASPGNFILQVISFDAPSVSCATQSGPYCDSRQQEVTNAPAPMNDSTTPPNVGQENETNACGTAAVSVTSLSYGVFKMPQ